MAMAMRKRIFFAALQATAVYEDATAIAVALENAGVAAAVDWSMYRRFEIGDPEELRQTLKLSLKMFQKIYILQITLFTFIHKYIQSRINNDKFIFKL